MYEATADKHRPDQTNCGDAREDAFGIRDRVIAVDKCSLTSCSRLFLLFRMLVAFCVLFFVMLFLFCFLTSFFLVLLCVVACFALQFIHRLEPVVIHTRRTPSLPVATTRRCRGYLRHHRGTNGVVYELLPVAGDRRQCCRVGCALFECCWHNCCGEMCFSFAFCSVSQQNYMHRVFSTRKKYLTVISITESASNSSRKP